MVDETPVRHVFFNAHHPGGRSKAAVAGAALVRPLGFCMLPVMLGALVSMLQGFAALHYLTIGFPIAITCAMGWTWIKVRGDICEIHIHDESVAIRSLMDAALPSSELQWKRLLHVEAESSHADLTLGLSTIRLTQSDWPEWTHILRALLRARTTR